MGFEFFGKAFSLKIYFDKHTNDKPENFMFYKSK